MGEGEGSWLDREPANWNHRMSRLPRPVSLTNPAEARTRCGDLVRQPDSPAERALVRAGWVLYGPVQYYGLTKAVTAMSGVDAMCRPLGYQAFIYWEGRYAGTLAPNAVVEVKLLDVSRADAAGVTIAEQVIRTAGRQVPIPFELRYDPRQIEGRRRYVVQARILEGGRLRFINTDAHPVITGRRGG